MFLVSLGIMAISFLLAPVGCLLLWQRYNYFSDGLAHACIFSGILGYFLDIPQILSMAIVSVLFAIMIYLFKFLSNRNNVINIVSALLVALAITISSKIGDKSVIEMMLFGDILSLDYSKLYMIGSLAILSISAILYFQKELILICLNRDIAKSNLVKVNQIELISLILCGLVIALTVKIIGSLLIGALLIIPASSARLVSNNPLQMIIISLLFSLISGMLGLAASFIYDIPTSSAIVIVCIIIYGIINFSIFMKR